MKNSICMLCGLLPLFLDVKSHHETVSSLRLVPDDTTGALFFDNFSGGLQSGWQGDTTAFEITTDGLLPGRQASPPAYISVASDRTYNTVWEAGIQLDGHLSASNYMRLYLVANSPALTGHHYGYHLQLDGANGKHVYTLWEQNGSTRKSVFQSDSVHNDGSGFRARVRVTRGVHGQWQIFADESGRGAFNTVPGRWRETDDDKYVTQAYAGYFVNFTPGRRADHRLDYLLIKALDQAADSVTYDKLIPQDLLINEVLSYPKPGGTDFVEIYNFSDKIIDLRRVSIARVNALGAPGSKRPVVDRPAFIAPGEYKVLTRRATTIMQHYPNSRANTFIEVPGLPDFNNETGGVVLYGDSTTIDSLFYNPSMHSPLISVHQGVSLERQQFSVPANAPGNFRSASTAVGGATPGYENSGGNTGVSEETIYLNSKTFSPDGDGFEDALEILYRLPESGFMISVSVYSDGGQLVRRLVRNQSVGTQGTLVWDGRSDTGRLLPVGIYVAIIDLYHPSGESRRYRRSFVLAAKL